MLDDAELDIMQDEPADFCSCGHHLALHKGDPVADDGYWCSLCECSKYDGPLQ